MDPKTIWNEKQNKPTYVVRDLLAYAPADVVYTSLLRRGVFKWLAARRKLIVLKDIWRDRITASIAEQKQADPRRREWLRGYRAGLEECRKEVRAICHGPRWEAPDHDKAAREWLDKYGGN